MDIDTELGSKPDILWPMHNQPTPAYVDISAPELRFVADTHFRDATLPGEADRRRRFQAFLETVPGDSCLLLMGDIFDFFFEYRGFVLKKYFDIFYALHTCALRGVDLRFMGGNHDYWAGGFLSDEIGIQMHNQDDLFIRAQGRKLWCTHGDLYLPGDNNYRKVRAIIRNPLVIGLTKILHPDLLNTIATRVSNKSKTRRRLSQEQIAAGVAESVAQNGFSNGNDAFIMGHVHHPLLENRGSGDFMIVGDWIQNFTYGKLRDGKLTLESFAE